MILKLQQGGYAVPPLVSYQPVIVSGAQETSSAPSSKSSSSDNDLIDKDMLKMLEKLDGLPSDMSVLEKSLRNFQIDQKYGLYPDTSNIATKYISALFKMKQANFNHESYKQAMQTVINNGGINEFAVTERGQLFCLNKENSDYKLLTPEQLKENQGYTPLTNAELLYLRANSPELAYKNDILKVVQNGIGMESINKMIQQIISNLGVSETQKSGYSPVYQGKILGGLKIITEAAAKGAFDETAMSLDGLYKTSAITREQGAQAQQALSYIYKTLPLNAKAILKIKSDGTESGVQNLLLSLITSSLSNSIKFDTDLQKDLNPDGTKKATEKEKKEAKEDELTPAQMFQLDMGAERDLVIKAGTTDQLTIHASYMPISNKTGNLQGVVTLDKVANDSQFGGLFNFNQVSMGDQLIDMGSLKNVVVNANQLYKAYLPIDQEKAAKGIIAPNLNYLKTLEQVRNEIKRTGVSTPEEINAIYENARLPKFVDENGKVNEQYYKPFGVLNASAYSGAFKEDTDLNSSYFEEIRDKNEAENVLSIISGDKKENKIEWDPDDAWIFEGSYNSVVKGLIFLPLLSTDPTLGALSSGQGMTHSRYTDIQSRVQADKRISSFKEEGELDL